MFDDLLADLGRAFAAAAAPAAAAHAYTKHAAKEETGKNAAEEGVDPASPTGEHSGGKHGGGSAGGGEGLASSGGENCAGSAPVFRVTEYDVTSGKYPESWEDYDGAKERALLCLFIYFRFLCGLVVQVVSYHIYL